MEKVPLRNGICGSRTVVFWNFCASLFPTPRATTVQPQNSESLLTKFAQALEHRHTRTLNCPLSFQHSQISRIFQEEDFSACPELIQEVLGHLPEEPGLQPPSFCRPLPLMDQDCTSQPWPTITHALQKPQFQTQSLRLSDLHRKSQLWRGIVSVTLIEGCELKAMDANGLSDPYVKFRLGHQKYKSKVILAVTEFFFKCFVPVWCFLACMTFNSGGDLLLY
uniref:Multiple C2 and transmembrane domain containing 1 n=1 Tax=Ficedula albicollis TaxID=59894 RepID=A0A803W7H7_FICAL